MTVLNKLLSKLLISSESSKGEWLDPLYSYKCED